MYTDFDFLRIQSLRNLSDKEVTQGYKIRFCCAPYTNRYLYGCHSVHILVQIQISKTVGIPKLRNCGINDFVRLFLRAP